MHMFVNRVPVKKKELLKQSRIRPRNSIRGAGMRSNMDTKFGDEKCSASLKGNFGENFLTNGNELLTLGRTNFFCCCCCCFFFLRIYFMIISRMKFAKIVENFEDQPAAGILKTTSLH